MAVARGDFAGAVGAGRAQVWDWGCRVAAGRLHQQPGQQPPRPAAAAESCPEQPPGGGVAAAATHNVKSSDRPPSHLSTLPPPCCDNDIPGGGPCGVVGVVVGVVGGGVAGCRVRLRQRAGSWQPRHTHSPVAADCDRGATCYCVTQATRRGARSTEPHSAYNPPAQSNTILEQRGKLHTSATCYQFWKEQQNTLACCTICIYRVFFFTGTPLKS